MSALKEKWLTVLYPHHCFLCDTVLLPEKRMCDDCFHRAPYVLPPVCERCGRGEDVCICGGHTHAFERCVSPFYHEDMVRDSILRLKQRYDTVVAEGFASEMAEVIRREYGGIAFDWVTSVPLHKKDRRARGFAQAQGLAQALARRLGLPYVAALTKLTYTQPQKELTALRRRGNLLGVFDITADVAGRTVLLVDDVITTGSTLDECAKMLKIYGAKAVYVLAVAVSENKKEQSDIEKLMKQKRREKTNDR